MNEYNETTYGESIAEAFDELFPELDPESIRLLAELAGDGPTLELGIGTGRIALPLREEGIDVQGIDASEAMLSRLRAKKGGNKIEVMTGSFADFEIEKHFQLIYVVFNTFFALLTQEEQVQCFQRVREHLSSDGVFLLEVFVPDMSRFDAHQAVRTARISQDSVQLVVSEHDPVVQQIISQHVLLTSEGNRLYPVKLRYVWPSELDLMARIAGLSLRHRWSSWLKEEFTRESTKHISVYAPVDGEASIASA